MKRTQVVLIHTMVLIVLQIWCRNTVPVRTDHEAVGELMRIVDMSNIQARLSTVRIVLLWVAVPPIIVAVVVLPPDINHATKAPRGIV